MVKWLIRIVPLLWVSSVLGANLPTGAQIEVLTDFSGGLNTSSPQHKIPKNMSPNMRNVFIHRSSGRIIKRPGFTSVGSTNTLMAGTLMFTFNKEDGSKEFIVSDDSIVLTTQDFQTYIFISSGLSPTVHLCAIQVRNKVWFTNGINSVFTWDGTVKQILDGTNSTPNVPRFRYLYYDQERVWGANTSNNGSILQWTDVASTAGVAIAPDHFLAWPVTNGLNIGQGDGSVITALWVYKSQLQIGKERSIYTRYGTNTSSYFVRRVESQAGVSSNESVVLLDGLTYYKGFNGIYAFDGGVSKRISDEIVPDVQAMVDATNLIKQNVWETQSQFLKGQFSGSTVTADGFLTQRISSETINYIQASVPGTNFVTFTSTDVREGGKGQTGYAVYQPTYTVSAEFLGYPRYVAIWAKWNDDPTCVAGNSHGLSAVFHNSRTGQTSDKKLETISTSFSKQEFPLTSGFHETADFVDFPVTGDDINTGKFSINITTQEDTHDSHCVFEIYPVTVTFSSTMKLNPNKSGQYISDIATNPTITAWGSFDSINNTNGGTINYYVRSATAVVNITTQTWKPIGPGTILSEPLQNRFIQWASTLTGTICGDPTCLLIPNNIDNVEINHVEGASSNDRPFAIDWNNEYWLSVTTQVSSALSIQYVKSWVTNNTPNAWNPLSAINIRSMCKNGTSALYGGAASTGTFYRLDYGTNDNGAAIDAFYETPQITLKGALTGGYDGNWMEEQLHELWLDLDVETGNTFRLGSSFNGGSFTEETVSISGTDRYLKVLYTPNKFAKYFKWRFRNNQVDKGLGLNNFAVIYTPSSSR